MQKDEIPRNVERRGGEEPQEGEDAQGIDSHYQVALLLPQWIFTSSHFPASVRFPPSRQHSHVQNSPNSH